MQPIEHHGLLLVDTDIAFRDELSVALERFGIPIVWRAGVPGLLQAIAEARPLALVLSADLPGGETTEILRSTRAQEQWNHLPVYVVGSALSRSQVLRAYVDGADAVLDRRAAVPEIAARALRQVTVRDRGRSDPTLPYETASLPVGGPERRATDPRFFDVSAPTGSAAPVRVPMAAVPIGVSPSIRDLRQDPPSGPKTLAATPVVVPDVIIVEDDPSLLEMLRYALTNRGYQTLSFSNGLDALRAMREMDTAGKQPVVLLDVDLPGIDGFRILHELSGSRPGDYQVILCTVHNSEATQVLGIQSGALDYLVKPLRMPIVLAKVGRLVGRGSFTSAAQA